MSANMLALTTSAPQVLVSQQLGTVDAAVYTVPAATTVRIANASVCNTTGSAVTVNIGVVKAGGTVGDGTHRIISGYSLAAGDSLPLKDYLGDHVLGPGDIVSAFAGTATAVDMVMSGVVMS